MRRIPLGWSVIIVLVGCGFILFAGGKSSGVEGWQPLNTEIEEALDQKTADAPKGNSKTEPDKEAPEKVGGNNSSDTPVIAKETMKEAAALSSETVPDPIAASAETASVDAKVSGTDLGESSSDQSGKINVNTADQSALMDLPGIGEKKAQAIIDYRTKNGPFRSVEGLMDVKGIGPKMLEKMKPYVGL